MRTTKELLKIMLDSIDLMPGGLCVLSVRLTYFPGNFTSEEQDRIHRYIINNRPSLKSKLADKTRSITDAYYWDYGLIPPRVRWLKYHIRICKE